MWLCPKCNEHHPDNVQTCQKAPLSCSAQSAGSVESCRSCREYRSVQGGCLRHEHMGFEFEHECIKAGMKGECGDYSPKVRVELPVTPEGSSDEP